MTALRAALNTVLALPLLLWAGEIMTVTGMAPSTAALAQSGPMQGSNLPNPFNQRLGDDRIETANDYAVLFVDPTAGVDQAGGGGQRQPLRTITYALQIAAPNTVIVLSPGTYSTESGEQFPLRLRPGVTVQGNPSSSAPRALIRGGGDFVSPALSLQNVAVVAADRSGLAHVMVVNPNGQGQGVWIEAGSPVLIENVFAGSGHAGIFIAGRGEPMIARNHFYQNEVAGLVIYGASAATVQGNLFEQTGVGITVSESAMPRIINNRIVQNQEGVVLLSGANPVLEGNDIRQNRRNGVVDFGDAPAIAALMRPAAEPNMADSAASPAVPTPIDTTSTPDAATAGSNVVHQPVPTPSETATAPTPEAGATDEVEPIAPVAELTAVPDPTEAAVVPPTESPTPVVETGSPAASPTSPPPAETASIHSSGTTANPSSSPPQAVDSPATTPESSLPDLPAPIAPTVDPLPTTDEASIAEPAPGLDVEPSVEAGPDTANHDQSLPPVALAIGPTPEPSHPDALSPNVSAASLPAESSAAANPTAISASLAPNPDPGPDVDALFERLNIRRPGDLSRPIAGASNSSEQASNPSAEDTVQPDAVEIDVIPPPEEAAPEPPPLATGNALPSVPDNVASLPEPSGDVLRVPDPNVPIGSPGGMSNVVVPATLAEGGSAPPSPPSRAAALGLYYRVLVEAPDEVTQNQVRSIVSDAFRTRFQGRVMMQTGAYEDESVANEMVEMLRHYGLNAQVEDIRQN